MTSRIKILVTGSNGQLGSELKEMALSYPQTDFIFLDRNQFSITDSEACKNFFELHKPQYFINCAAYTAVDKAEDEKEKAFEINGNAVGNMALLCHQYHCKFVHVSTDYVFNGNSQRPLKETDAVDPVNAYGESKLLGEQLALKNNPDAVIIRTSWVYSYYGKNFVKTMLRLMNEKESIQVVSDQMGSPTYAADLAETIIQITNSKKWMPGIYNYSNEGIISWFEFAVEIKKLTNSSCMVHPVTTEQFTTPARRPAYSVLDKSKIEKIYQIKIKSWKDSLKTCLKKLDVKIE